MPHDLSPGRDLTSQHRIQGASLSYIIKTYVLPLLQAPLPTVWCFILAVGMLTIIQPYLFYQSMATPF
jgi:hypothetical protein